MDRYRLASAFVILVFLVGCAWAHNPHLKAFFKTHRITTSTRFPHGGSCDMVYKLNLPQGDPMVLRVMRRTRSLGKRKQIVAATEWAAAAQLGPDVIWYDPDHVALVTAYIHAPHPAADDLKAPSVWDGLAKKIAEIHRSSPDSVGPTLSLKTRALKRWREVQAYVDPSDQPFWQKLFVQIQNIHPDTRKQFIHGDLKMENMFLQNGKILFIDWGEAGYGSIYDDLGALFYYTSASDAEVQEFMHTYLGRPLRPDEFKTIKQHKRLAALNDTLWKARQFCAQHAHDKPAITKHLDFFNRFL